MIYAFMFFIIFTLYYISQLKTSNGNDKAFLKLFFYVPSLLLLTFFIGLRSNVGRDYSIYYDMFYYHYGTNKELGYRLINYLFSKWGLDLYFVLTLMAFLSVFFVYKIINKLEVNKGLSFLIFLLGGPCIYLFNVVRQGLTNIIFIYIIHKYQQKKYLTVLLLILLSSLFHYSIFLAILFLPLLIKTYSRKFLLISYICAIILDYSVNIQTLSIRFLKYIPHFGNIYLDSNLMEEYITNSNIGLGYIFNLFLVFIVILNYPKLSKQKEKLPYINAFVFWGIFKILTLQVWLFERILDYLWFSIFIVVPTMIMNIENKKIKFIFSIFIVTCFLILFIKATVLSSPEEKLIPYHWIFSK